MVLVILVVVCILFAIATYYILYQLGVLPGPGASPGASSGSTVAPFGARTPLQEARRQTRELPQGCLVSLLVGATLWFLGWGVVLVLALRFLSDPFGS